MNARRLVPFVALACAWLALAAFALFAAGCSEKVTPVAPHVNLPPEAVTMFPAPRATGVFYDTSIWAQFDRELDAASVDTFSVYLKLDTRRQPVTVTYQPIVRRVLIVPRGPLELGRMYTVEVSARVRTQDGDSLGAPLRWQFTTNTLRRLVYEWPAEGALEGPHVMLQWGGNGAASNNILYEVHASSDSAAVANRTFAPLQTHAYLNYLPRIAWESGRRTFWSVTAINLTSGERLSGGVRSFEVYPADAPVDSMVVPIADYGGAGSNNRVQFCGAATLPTGPSYNAGMRWSLNGERPWLRVADARLTMYASTISAGTVGSAGTQLWYAQNPWNACLFTLNGIPYTESNGLVATAVVNGLRAEYREPALAAFTEAAGRWGNWHGVLFRGNANVTWDYLTPGVPGPELTVWYYRTPSTPGAIAAR